MEKDNILEKLKKVKNASRSWNSSTSRKRNMILKYLVDELGKNKENIIESNKLDVENARKNSLNSSFIKRLKMDENSIEHMIVSLKKIADMDDSINRVVESRILKNGLKLKKVSIPIGVIFVIYESRPEVTINTCALSIKSGNGVILKGGKEAIRTNRVLINCVYRSLEKSGREKNTALFVDSITRKEVIYMLSQHKYIDLVIPRGGYSLVNTVITHSKIPVLSHASGGARIYIDNSADLDIALKIIINAKTSKPATCNSVDTILIHCKIPETFLTKLYKSLNKKKVEILGDEQISKRLHVVKANISDWNKEFLGLKILIGIVDGVDEAIEKITKYTKHHSEGIIARDRTVINKFLKSIDAAAIFINCSTRLHDGGIFGMGEEIGISTSKIHARGPVGLKELTTYKWIAEGNGQIRK